MRRGVHTTSFILQKGYIFVVDIEIIIYAPIEVWSYRVLCAVLLVARINIHPVKENVSTSTHLLVGASKRFSFHL